MARSPPMNLGRTRAGQDDGAADMALIQPHGDSHLLQVHADKGAADVQARVGLVSSSATGWRKLL